MELARDLLDTAQEAVAQALLAWALLAPEDAASQERMREARSIFTRLGASGDVARAERALKAR